MKIDFKYNFWGYLKPTYKPSGKLLRSWGNVGVSDVQRNFDTSGRNIFNTWKPLAESTIAKRKGGSNKPLIDTGQLSQSVSKKISGQDVYITTNRIDKHGENIAYNMNYGCKNGHVPAREFMKFSPSAIENMISDQKKEVLNGN